MRGLLPFLAQRLFRALIALWLVSTVVFVVMRLSGDPVPLLLPPDAPRSEMERVRRELGLDRSIPVQYAVFLRNTLRLDFGRSLHFREPAFTVVRGYIAATLELGLTAFFLAVLRADYIRTARAKGLGEAVVVAKHTLKNAAIPILTITALQFGTLLGGAVVTETVFAWPGIGRLAVQSINNRDYPVVQCTVFIAAVMFIAINFAVDLLYGVLDPRARAGCACAGGAAGVAAARQAYALAHAAGAR